MPVDIESARDELYLDRLSEAKDEERFERATYDGEIKCEDCKAVTTIAMDRKTDEPYNDPEPCENCGSTHWVFA